MHNNKQNNRATNK